MFKTEDGVSHESEENYVFDETTKGVILNGANKVPKCIRHRVPRD